MICFRLAVLLLTFIAPLVANGELPGCIDSDVKPEYEPALRGNEYLVRWGGVDSLTLKNGAEVLVGVGQVSIKPGVDFLVWRRVAESKASRSVSEFLRADISSISTLVKSTTMISDDMNGELQQRSRRVEKFLSSRIDQRTQMAARIETIGHWASKDGKYGYVAVAVKPLDK
jgi:hypothetical protein